MHHSFDADPDRVFALLADPDSYPRWLIGAKRIRHVDREWPAPGTRFDHEVGVGGPLTVEDSSVSQGVGPGRHLELEVRFRPLGRAEVTFDVSSEGDGTLVSMEEHPIGPLAALSWALGPLIAARNAKSLANLDRVLDQTSRGAGSGA